MNEARRENRAHHITLLALLFEGGLGLLALLLGWLWSCPPLESVWGQTTGNQAWAIAWGSAAALPLFGLLMLWDLGPLKWLAHLRRVVRQEVVPLFRGATTWQLLAIAVAAGVGEELLFRGVVQAGLRQALGAPAGTWIGLATGALLFGACHWLTHEYALLATFIGIVLGGLFLLTGNLLAPIAMHSLYDFLALVYLVRR